MKTALIIGGLGMALAMLAPAVRTLLARHNSMTDEEYFAAARRRAIGFRLTKRAANERPAQVAGDE